MPFHDGVYYPYASDAQGTHSSAGIPSLLNSPLSQPSAAPVMTPSSGAASAAAMLPFKFRPRRESVDWRRIGAVDVEMVVSQLDVEALQEHIGAVTFCSLEGERCQRCHSPVDPALVKLLQLAQLTVEWLLHCQEFLSANVRAAEERLAAGARDREQLLAGQREQEEKVKALTAELKQRKKLLRSQQSMFAPRITNSQKCPQCDKTFLNSSFLQNHMQRRHPDEYELHMRSDSEKKYQVDSFKQEIGRLREQITQQQQDLLAKTAQEKENQSMQKELLRELERFKAEEMARMERKIEDSRDGMRREMEFLYTRNIQALNEVNQNQMAKHETSASSVHSQPERDLDNYREMQMQAMHKLEHQLNKQDKKWESRLKEMKAQHESEKNQLLNELSRTQLSVSEQQESSRRLQQEMSRRLQEREHTIKSQREQIRNISANPPTKIVEVPVMVSAPAPEPKPKRVVHEEPVCALKLEPIQELSEEEKDSSSFSERRLVEKKPDPVPEKKPRKTPSSTLKRNASIKRDMRPGLEEAVIMKLENLGVKPDQSGLKNKDLNSILAKVHSKRESVAKGMPDYWRQREELSSSVDQQLGGQRRGSDPAPEAQARSRQSARVLQIRPRSSSLPSGATRVMSGPAPRQPKTPQPAPRTRSTSQPKTSTPNTKAAQRTPTPKTPPFSSGEESEDEDTDMAEEQPQKHHRGKSSRADQAGQPNPAPTPAQAPASLPHSSTAVTKMESEEEDDDDWSEVSELKEVDPAQVQRHRDQNGNVDKDGFGKGTKVDELTRKVEKQLSERVVKKPPGGVSVLPERKDEVQELTYTDLEESSEWMGSSLEDGRDKPKPAQSSGPLRKSLDSASTSAWGTSTGKAPKSGLTEAGTGSSLYSLSDISDSEDFVSNRRNRHF